MFNLSFKFDEKKFMRNIKKTVVKKIICTWKIPSSICMSSNEFVPRVDLS